MKFRLLFILCLIASVTLAQHGNIKTDRPYQTITSAAIPVKTFQIETGFRYADKKTAKEKAKFISYNATLFKYGLFKRFELRLGLEYKGVLVMSNIKPVDETGWAPFEIGTKFYIIEEKGWRPEIAFMGQITPPFIGEEDFLPEKLVPEFRFLFSHNIGKRLYLGYNIGLTWPKIAKKDIIGIYTIVLRYSIFDRLFCFVENYAYIDSLFGIDGGFTYLLKNNFQLDLYGGYGLNPESPDNFIGIGLSWRIPR